MRAMDIFDRLMKAGFGPTALALRLGVRQSVVSNWKSRGRVPAERVLEVEQATGIPREEIRPDLYRRHSVTPTPQDAAA